MGTAQGARRSPAPAYVGLLGREDAEVVPVLRAVLARAAALLCADGVFVLAPDGGLVAGHGSIAEAAPPADLESLVVRPRREPPGPARLVAAITGPRGPLGELLALRRAARPFTDDELATAQLMAEVAAAALASHEVRVHDDLSGARADALRSLHASAAQLRALIDSTPLGVALVHRPDLRLVRTNGALAALTGLTGQQLDGVSLPALATAADREDLVGWLTALPEDSPGERRELRLLGPEGQPVWVRLSAAPVRGLPEDLLVVQAEDVTVQREAEQLLRRMARTDPLTGLANRGEVERRLAAALSRPSRQHVGVLFIDLDAFKAVNDAHGHPVGDELLVVVAERLLEAVRPGDLVGRIGGDEFMVVLEGLADAEELCGVQARVAEAVSRDAVLADGHVLAVSASVGAARGHTGETSAERLLRAADAAMYAEKRRRQAGR